MITFGVFLIGIVIGGAVVFYVQSLEDET